MRIIIGKSTYCALSRHIYKHIIIHDSMRESTRESKPVSMPASAPVLTPASLQTIDPAFLKEMRKPLHHDELVEKNIAHAKQLIAQSNTTDIIIIQTINAIDELTRIANTLAKRLREWYGYYLPELSRRVEDHELFIKTLLQKSREEYLAEKGITQSMGAAFATADIETMHAFAREINDLYFERERLLAYLETVLKSAAPNMYALVGAMIGAKLLEKAGSLRQLAFLPASTIQLLGAEKALFRHLRNRKIRPPKHGYILSHSYVISTKDKGKAARVLAAKISICAKVDYFKGEYVADKIKEELGI